MSSSEVVFAQRSDAFQALKQYNNVQLDVKPMRIEIIGTNSEIPVSARVNVVGGVNGRRIVVMPAGCGRGSAAINRQSGESRISFDLGFYQIGRILLRRITVMMFLRQTDSRSKPGHTTVQKIKHFSHKHSLIFSEEHLSDAMDKIQQVVRHDAHQHPLISIQRPALFFCFACGREHRGASYLCTTCGFWINQKCALLPSSIKYTSPMLIVQHQGQSCPGQPSPLTILILFILFGSFSW
ncbi:THO complex subunit 4D [Camellia lanceoleosa]|uniref:THO complex subunit 4D n=1 Tax=Camellia lanceoleosa TaxID=1840588 RepID=A0ACC0FVM0_9ERIC|nr:THO complex subunit 4D [Camellia lanceoleosa]